VRCAARGRFVDSLSRSDAPALLPGHGPATRRPLPSTGSPRHGFPGFTGTMERSDSRPSFPSHFVSFARRLLPRAPVFVTPTKPDAGLGPGVFGSGHPSAACGYRGGDGRASQVPGEPSCAYALFSDPGRSGRGRSLHRAAVAPARSTTKATHESVISGLNRTALALAVYASPAGLLAEDARLASGC